MKSELKTLFKVTVFTDDIVQTKFKNKKNTVYKLTLLAFLCRWQVVILVQMFCLGVWKFGIEVMCLYILLRYFFSS